MFERDCDMVAEIRKGLAIEVLNTKKNMTFSSKVNKLIFIFPPITFERRPQDYRLSATNLYGGKINK